MPDALKRFLLQGDTVSIRKRLYVPIIVLLSICLICPISLYLIEMIPRYVDLSIPPPDHFRGEILGEWSTTVRSTVNDTPAKYYILREEAVVDYDPAHGITSWQSIVDYFDVQMNKKGWVRTEKYLPCRLFMPEADFLEPGEFGPVSYLSKAKADLFNYDDGDFACLAIWADKEKSDVFTIVLETIHPSFLTQGMNFFSQ